VLITVNEEQVEVQNINLIIEGFERYEEQTNAHSEWQLVESEEVYNKKIEFGQEDEQLDEESITTGIVLKEGTKCYDFAEKLPLDLPGSFNHETLHYGKKVRCSIIYNVIIRIEFVDIEAKPVEVRREFLMPENLKKRAVKVITTSKCVALCAKANGPHEGFVDMKIRLDRDIFFPGSKVQIHSDITNESSKYSMNGIIVKLVQNVTLRSTSLGMKQLVSEVARNSYEGIDTREQDIRSISFLLPATVSQQTSGKLVRCDYRLIIHCETTMMTVEDVSVSLPISLVPSQPLRVAKSAVPQIVRADSRALFKNYYGEEDSDEETDDDDEECLLPEKVSQYSDNDYHKRVTLPDPDVSSGIKKKRDNDRPCCSIM
jgi:hypothetical protein